MIKLKTKKGKVLILDAKNVSYVDGNILRLDNGAEFEIEKDKQFREAFFPEKELSVWDAFGNLLQESVIKIFDYAVDEVIKEQKEKEDIKEPEFENEK